MGRRWSDMTRRWICCCVVAATVGLGACRFLTDPELPNGALRFSPPGVYDLWWQMTESCAGVRGSLANVKWYRAAVKDIHKQEGSGIDAYWSPDGNRIVIASEYSESGLLVRHEMLHALVGAGGHSRKFFLDRCAGVVNCERSCRVEAGPPGSPPANAVMLLAEQLELSVVVTPPTPSSAQYGGHFNLTVFARNPLSKPAVVMLRPSGDAGPPASFSFRMAHELGWSERDERADDPAVKYFRAGESKRFVFDFLIGGPRETYGVTPGVYEMSGAYGLVWSAPIPVTVMQ